MNIKDLPKNSYTAVPAKPLNIKDLPIDSYQAAPEDISKVGMLPPKKSIVGDVITEVTKKKREASSGFLGTFLPALATLPQAAGELAGHIMQKKTIENIGDDISRNADTATELLKKIQAEKDPVKKENLRVILRNIAKDVSEKSANLSEMATGEGIREATKIDLGPIGKIPALPSTDDPVELAKTIVGRSIKQIGVAAAPQLGATAAFGAIGAGQALEEGKTPLGVAATTLAYAGAGRLFGLATDKVVGTELAQRVMKSPVGSTVLKVGEKVFSPFMAKAAPAGTFGADVDLAFSNFGKLADKVFTPSTYLKPVTGVLEAGAEKIGIRGTPEERLQGAQKKITNYWNDTKARYQTAVKYDKNSPEILGREGIIPQGRNGAMYTKDQAEIIRMKGASEHSLLNKVLDESQLYGSADSYKKAAIDSITKNFKGVERQQALNAFEKQFNALLNDNSSQVVVGASGEKRLPIRIFNDMKSYMWSQGYPSSLAPKSDQVVAETMRVSGNAAKNYIDLVARDESAELADAIMDLNQHSGELFQAEKFLNSMNGKKLPFGQFSRNFSRVVGAIVGAPGGVGGSIIGSMTADQLVTILQNPNVSVGRAAQIVSQLNKTTPQVVEDALRILNDMGVKKGSMLLLPEGPIITPPPTGKPITDAEKFANDFKLNSLKDANTLKLGQGNTIYSEPPTFKGTSPKDMAIQQANNDEILNTRIKGNTKLPPLKAINEGENTLYNKNIRKLPDQAGTKISKLVSHEGAPDTKTVAQYKADIQAGKKIEPIKIIAEGDGKFGIEDGKHRFQAYKELGYDKVPTVELPSKLSLVEEAKNYNTLEDFVKAKVDEVHKLSSRIEKARDAQAGIKSAEETIKWKTDHPNEIYGLNDNKRILADGKNGMDWYKDYLKQNQAELEKALKGSTIDELIQQKNSYLKTQGQIDVDKFEAAYKEATKKTPIKGLPKGKK